MKRINRNYNVRNFHQAKWDEPIIMDLHQEGERGVIPPHASEEVTEQVGNGVSALPNFLKRKNKPNLPEITQNRVLRHYLRLSQETLGAALNVEMGQGTCTMKYSPIVNEEIANSPEMLTLHPKQHEDTIQGILEIYYNLDLYMREISGMDYFSFQPGSGTQALIAMASITRAYHEAHGEAEQRDEIITTVFSHPSQGASAAIKGYKVITIYPDEDGFPDINQLREAVSERTAGFVVANPEDTGVYNPRIKEFTDIVHEAGGVCYYDQANANGLLGKARARDAGFDMCFFNLHKTFSTPHASGGPAAGALGVSEKFKPFLPKPIVEKKGNAYTLNGNLENSIGKVRSFHGVAQNILRAYAWIRALGPEGVKQVAEYAVLNSNYLYNQILKIKGVNVPYTKTKRLEQIRYSWGQLTEETGVTTDDIARRMADFGHQYWTSHHPAIVEQPFTPEPTESYSKADLDDYVAALDHISNEAYTEPETVKKAPYNSSIHKVKNEEILDDPDLWAVTWRAYLKKTKEK